MNAPRLTPNSNISRTIAALEATFSKLVDAVIAGSIANGPDGAEFGRRLLTHLRGVVNGLNARLDAAETSLAAKQRN